MSKLYDRQKRASPTQAAAPVQTASPKIGNQSMEALMRGTQAPSAQNMGRKVDLPDAIRGKMENAFGADLSGVRLYESQAVADAGANAITMGSKIAFAPGKLDFSSSGGQALLGHELSHVVSQARGEVTGAGFLNHHGLEARADREGALAAAGESVYAGPVAPLSASSIASAAGPMQASKPKKKGKTPQKPAAHIIAEDPMPAMYDYGVDLAKQAAALQSQPIAPPQEEVPLPPQEEALLPPQEEAPLPPQEEAAAAPEWKSGVSPTGKYLNMLDEDARMSADERQQQLHNTRVRETERFVKWHNAHVGGGSMQTPYEGAFGTRVYSDDRNYKIMNNLMRTGLSPEVANGRAVETSEMKDALQASDALSRNLTTGEHTRLEQDTVVHRGAKNGYGQALYNQLHDKTGVNGQNLAQAITGNVFTDSAFSSTSINPAKANQFGGMNQSGPIERNVVHAVMPKGMQTQFISPASKFKDEDEMLLNRETPMRVLSAENKVKSIRNHQGQVVEQRPYREIKGVYLRALAGGHRRKK